jgi:hypothetical protein
MTNDNERENTDPANAGQSENPLDGLDYPWLEKGPMPRRESFRFLAAMGALFALSSSKLPTSPLIPNAAAANASCENTATNHDKDSLCSAPPGGSTGGVTYVGNPDGACSTGGNGNPNGPNFDHDAKCGNGQWAAGGPNHDEDESCFLTPHSSPDKSLHSKDEGCSHGTIADADVDQACGDCDDQHDTDESCGKYFGDDGTPVEPDENCGHPHATGGDTWGIDEDGACNKPAVKGGTDHEADQGCGSHSPEYAWPTPVNDKDQSCPALGGMGDSDANCSLPEGTTAPAGPQDNTCGTRNPRYTTSRDEGCQHGLNSPRYDEDQACRPAEHEPHGDYDRDEACGSLTPAGTIDRDGACGRNTPSLGGGLHLDKDQSCYPTSGSQYADQTCSLLPEDHANMDQHN